MDYASMLKQGKKKLPEVVEENFRFEIPKVKGSLQGNKTVISNLLHIATHLHRKSEHLIKYLTRELGMPAEVKGNFVIFTGKTSSAKFNEKITAYADNFVTCKECNKPDTTLSKQGGVTFIQCQACGAKYSVTSKI